MSQNKQIIEWKTVSLTVFNYIMWFVWLTLYQWFPSVAIVGLSLSLALHSSLMHEMIHGHPTHIAKINDALVYLPLSLLTPYPVYKRTHLTHHIDENLTYPGVDPESYFTHKETWRRFGPVRKAFNYTYMTLAGRLLLSPIVNGVLMIKEERQLFRSNPRYVLQVWVIHLFWVTVILVFVTSVMNVSSLSYLAAAYISNTIIALRSFFEHRIAEDPNHRIVVVHSNAFFKLLFLCNNFHAIHHRYPQLAWYEIEARFNAEREATLQKNGYFEFKGYYCWLTYLFKPVASPVFKEIKPKTDENNSKRLC